MITTLDNLLKCLFAAEITMKDKSAEEIISLANSSGLSNKHQIRFRKNNGRHEQTFKRFFQHLKKDIASNPVFAAFFSF